MKITRRQLRDLIKEVSEQELKALRQSSPDLEHPRDVVEAVLNALADSIPDFRYQVKERNAKRLLNYLYRAGYEVVKG